MHGINDTNGRDSRSTVGEEEEICTGKMGTCRIRRQAETMDREEEMGMVAEAMGIHPTSHTPKT